MITRSSVVYTVGIGWTCVALVYFVSQAYIAMGLSTKTLSTPMIMSLLVIVKNVGEPLFEKILSKYILPDSVVKYVHKYPVLKKMGVVSICSCSVFELVRYVAFGALCLVSVAGTFALPSTHLAGNLGSLLFRATIGFLLMKKLPLETFLPRMVSRMSREAAAGNSSAYSLLLAGLSCVLSDPWAGPDEANSPVSDDGASSTSAPQPLRTKGTAPPTGSAILLAVLLVAAVEAVVLAVALSCPLVLDLAEGTAGSHIRPDRWPLLMAPARSSGVLFSRPQCLLLVAGAVVQCAALVFAAGYLSYRRAIALELRAYASALTSAAGSPRSSTSASGSALTTATATATPATATTSASASSSPHSLSAFLLSLLDCDVRLSVCLESSRGGGRLSSVDAFAAGLQSATGVPTTTGVPTGAAPVVLPSPSNGNNGNGHSGNGNGKGGKAKLSVVIPPAGNGSNTSPRKGSTSTVEKGTSGAQGQGQGQGAQYAPQPHMLLVWVMPVLLVAILQTGQTLLRLADTRCSGGNAVAALASVLLVTFLRDAVPRAALPVAGSQVPVLHSAAATPQSTKH